MRCNECNKFASVDSENEPEVNVDLQGSHIEGTVEIENNCAECGGTLQTYSFDVEVDLSDEIEKHARDTKQTTGTIEESLELEDPDCSREDKFEGKGRGAKHFYGFTLNYSILCQCEVCKKRKDKTKVFNIEGATQDFIQSSHMDEAY
jgi:hypothetical protein